MSGVRRAALWLIALPLMLAGTETAHALAYRIVYPVASVRWTVLAETGHGYLGYTPIVLGIAGAAAAVGFASTVLDMARGRPGRALPAWTFGALPIVGFALQEFMERWLMTQTMPWWMVEQPTFRIGLLLQLPFALAAYAAARLLQRAAAAVARRLLPEVPEAPRAAAVRRRLEHVLRPRLAPLAAGSSGRGPPAFA